MTKAVAFRDLSLVRAQDTTTIQIAPQQLAQVVDLLANPLVTSRARCVAPNTLADGFRSDGRELLRREPLEGRSECLDTPVETVRSNGQGFRFMINLLRFDDLDQNPERSRRHFVSRAIKYQCVTDTFAPEIVGRLLEHDLASAEPSSELPKLNVDCRRIRGL